MNPEYEEKRQHLISEHNTGLGLKKLCEKYHVGKSTACRWIKEDKQIPIETLKSISIRELYLLKLEVATLRKQVAIIEKSKVTERLSSEEKCLIVDKLASEYGIHALCKTLGLRRSTYYYHCRAPKETQLEKSDSELRPLIKQIFDESKERFGAHKIKVVLNSQGMQVGEKRIVRLMKQMGLVCKQCRLRDWASANRQYKYYPDRLKKKFEQTAPNQVWVSDVTYVRVKEAFCYVCVIIDLFSRKVIECHVGRENSSDMILETFNNAFKKRGKPIELMLHNDQGANYTSYMFRSFLRELSVKQSFSHPCTPHDNAVNESFFACMKREELSHKHYTSEADLVADVEEYVRYFNTMRPHERLGDKTPDQIEQDYWDSLQCKNKAADSSLPESAAAI